MRFTVVGLTIHKIQPTSLSQRIPRVSGNSKGEARGRNRHKSNIVKILEERNAGTNEKSPKQGLTIAKDLTIERNS